MNQKLLLLFFLVFSGKFYSQTFEGKIFNESTSLPIENVSIQDIISSNIVFSDGQGRFTIEFQNIPAEVAISAIGFEPRKIRITEISKSLNIYLTPSFEDLSEVIVRSTLIPSELQKVPAAVSLITKKDLNRIDPANFSQVFNNIPGMFVNQGALNTTRINIRGIGARSQYSTNRIQAYFNGIPLTTAEGELTLDDFDPEALSRVEIIKGPSSSLYGAGLGGVINLYADEGRPGETKASYKNMFGSYNLNRKTVTASHATQNTSVFINYNDLYTDGFRENGEYDRKSLLVNANIKTTENHALSFLANFTRLKAFIPSSINREDFLNNPEVADRNWAQSRGFESYDRGLLGISYDQKISSALSNVTSVFLSFKDAYEPRPFDILKEERVSAGARTRFNLSTTILNFNSQISFGAEYYREWYETGTFENLFRQFEDRGSVLGERLSNNEQNRNYSNFFVQAAVNLSDRLKLETGVNVNNTNYSLTDLYVQDQVDQTGDYKFKTIVSPRLGLVYAVSDKKNFYGNISHGFSTPTVAETLTPEGQINTNLLPETGINYEIGFKASWLNNKLYTEIATYSIQIEDLLVAQRVAEDRYVGINAGKTSHTGIEFLLNYSLILNEFKIRPYSNMAFNFYEFKEFTNRENDFSGNQLPGVPQSTINLGIDVFFRNISFFGNVLAVGEIPLNDENSGYSQNYSVVNLRTTYDFEILPRLEVFLSGGVNNLLDEKYAASILTNAVGFGGAAPRSFYPGNPRNYYAGIGLNFNF